MFRDTVRGGMRCRIVFRHSGFPISTAFARKTGCVLYGEDPKQDRTISQQMTTLGFVFEIHC